MNTIDITQLKTGDVVVIQTKNNKYTLKCLEDSSAVMLISGGRFKNPITTRINGCNTGGSVLAVKKIIEGLYLEICHPDKKGNTISTSTIKRIKHYKCGEMN